MPLKVIFGASPAGPQDSVVVVGLHHSIPKGIILGEKLGRPMICVRPQKIPTIEEPMPFGGRFQPVWSRRWGGYWEVRSYGCLGFYRASDDGGIVGRLRRVSCLTNFTQGIDWFWCDHRRGRCEPVPGRPGRPTTAPHVLAAVCIPPAVVVALAALVRSVVLRAAILLAATVEIDLLVRICPNAPTRRVAKGRAVAKFNIEFRLEHVLLCARN
mmetsp:Transcript_91416/g.200332  ORF Transcript_91416/g.200332 Transcript_91416/m.200332 type:complete len:213 (+) Transcript_91416:1090-1728(+)